jgi:hypothetical protein
METRLGDIIDDFCIKCKRLMNHAVVSILDGKPAKVRCRTCYSDHDYRHELPPPPKVDPRKAALLQEALAKGPGAVAIEPVALETAAPETSLGEALPGEAELAPIAEKVKAKARGRK